MSKKKVLGIVISLMIIVFILVIGGGIFAANHFYSKVETTESLKPEEVGVIEDLVQKEEESNIVNIAVLGIDRDGDGSNGRSDKLDFIRYIELR